MLKQSPIIECFAHAEFQFAGVNGMRIATLSNAGINKENNDDQSVGDYIADLSAIPKRLVVGVEAPQWLSEFGIDAPSGLLEYRQIEDGTTVVRLHHQQYLLISGTSIMTGLPLGSSIFDLDEGRHGNVLVLDYECAEFAIGGPHVGALLAELCPMDLASAPDGVWLVTRMAHCEVSLQLGGGNDAACRVICSPAEGQFLFGIIEEVINEHDGSMFGFHDYLTIVENGGDH